MLSDKNQKIIDETMNIKTIDARGLSCPQPTLLFQELIAEGQFPCSILVDSGIQHENILRLANKSKCRIDERSEEDGYRLIITRQ